MSTLIDDGQNIHNELTETAIGTNPTHSQLAKDHDNHHFHEIAAKLAIHAVEKVGIEMNRFFKTGKYIIHPSDLVLNFFRHPKDSSWADDKIRHWAENNLNNVKRGESLHEVQHLHNESKRFLSKSIKELQSIQNKLNRLWNY